MLLALPFLPSTVQNNSSRGEWAWFGKDPASNRDNAFNFCTCMTVRPPACIRDQASIWTRLVYSHVIYTFSIKVCILQNA